jgi:hypothetical protein
MCHRRALTAITSTFSTFGLDQEETIGVYVHHILDCYAVLANLPNLYPTLVTTQAFNRLVSICTQVPDESVVLGVSIPHPFAFNAICGKLTQITDIDRSPNRADNSASTKDMLDWRI